MLERKLTEKEQKELNLQVRDALSADTSSEDRLLKYLKKFPADFTFARETIFHQISAALASGGTLIFLNYAVRHPALFKFVLEHTSDDVLNEAILYRESDIFDTNTLAFIACVEYNYYSIETKNTIDYLLQKISIETLNNAALQGSFENVMMLSMCIPRDFSGTLVKKVLDRMYRANIENWLFTPIEHDSPLTMFQALAVSTFTNTDYILLLYALKKINTKSLSDYINQHGFFSVMNTIKESVLFNGILCLLSKSEGWEEVYQKVILHEVLIKKLSVESIEKFMMLHPEFKNKIFEMTKWKGHLFNYLRNAYDNHQLTSRLHDAERLHQAKKDCLIARYKTIVNTTTIIPPLASIVMEYCEDPMLIEETQLRNVSAGGKRL